jgi:hypothetical protein
MARGGVVTVYTKWPARITRRPPGRDGDSAAGRPPGRQRVPPATPGPAGSPDPRLATGDATARAGYGAGGRSGHAASYRGLASPAAPSATVCHDAPISRATAPVPPSPPARATAPGTSRRPFSSSPGNSSSSYGTIAASTSPFPATTRPCHATRRKLRLSRNAHLFSEYQRTGDPPLLTNAVHVFRAALGAAVRIGAPDITAYHNNLAHALHELAAATSDAAAQAVSVSCQRSAAACGLDDLDRAPYLCTLASGLRDLYGHRECRAASRGGSRGHCGHRPA